MPRMGKTVCVYAGPYSPRWEGEHSHIWMILDHVSYNVATIGGCKKVKFNWELKYRFGLEAVD